MSDDEKEMKRLLGLYPKDFEAEMSKHFGESQFTAAKKILVAHKADLLDEDG